MEEFSPEHIKRMKLTGNVTVFMIIFTFILGILSMHI
jgi:hypothetical protein